MRKEWLIIGGVLIVLVVIGWLFSSPEDPRVAAQRAAQAQIVHCNEDCREDFHSTAEAKCPRHIENMAKYDFEWTDGVLGYKFERASALGRGLVRYSGSNVKFQNGFGAWQRMNYSCDLNVNTEEIVGYDVTER